MRILELIAERNFFVEENIRLWNRVGELETTIYDIARIVWEARNN